MPSQPRKKTSKKRKTSHTQKSKRKQTPKKTKSRVIRDLLIALVLIGLVFAAGMGYYHTKSDTDAVVQKKVDSKRVHVQKKKKPIEVKKKKKKNTEKHSVSAEKRSELQAARQIAKQREIAMNTSYREDSQKSAGHVKQPDVDRSRRPKLVIIIDDVATPKQLKEIQSIHLNLTPSLFPPSRLSTQTAKMAKKLKHYMVHFPMQAGNHPRAAMPNTITVKDSKKQMRARVKDIRKWFPACIYTNNHTGSVFTSDYHALHTMYGLLREEGFIFVDSRTSSKSKGKRVAKEYGDFYLHRDVFIDNIQKFGAIRKQLKIAVKKAKERGYAIAIGHPHAITLRSLKNSLDILVDVDVVYLDTLVK